MWQNKALKWKEQEDLCSDYTLSLVQWRESSNLSMIVSWL